MANKVTIIPNTSKVKVSQEETTIVTIQTPGPKGDTGRTAYTSTTDLEARNITSSGVVSATGGFKGDIQIDSFFPGIINTETAFRIPIADLSSDGIYPLRTHTVGFFLNIKQPNRINDAHNADELRIGDTLHNAGGIRLQAPSSTSSYISTNEDFTLDVETRNITLSGSTDVKGTVESEGLILTSPNGTRFKLTVENGGGLAATEL